MNVPWLHQYPIWLTAGLLLIVLLLALETGIRIGLRRRRSRGEVDKPKEGDLTLGAMLTILGLLLAFTYAFTLGRYDLRKDAVTNEANAIGTAFLRADLAADPLRSELREQLLEYARTRVIRPKAAFTEEEFQQAIKRSLEAQAKLWPTTRQMMLEGDLPPPIQASIVQAINEVLDAHTTRMKYGFDRLPGMVFALIVLMATAAVGVAAYDAALQGQPHRWRKTLFVLVLVALVLMIVDFDRPLSGYIQISQDSLYSVVKKMESALSKP